VRAGQGVQAGRSIGPCDVIAAAGCGEYHPPDRAQLATRCTATACTWMITKRTTIDAGDRHRVHHRTGIYEGSARTGINMASAPVRGRDRPSQQTLVRIRTSTHVTLITINHFGSVTEQQMSTRKSSFFYGTLIALASLVSGILHCLEADLAPSSFGVSQRPGNQQRPSGPSTPRPSARSPTTRARPWWHHHDRQRAARHRIQRVVRFRRAGTGPARRQRPSQIEQGAGSGFITDGRPASSSRTIT
jgi:hypothetical protein